MASTAARTNLEIVQEMYSAFNDGDVETVLGHMDPDIEWTEPEGSRYAGTYRGPDAITEHVFAPVMEDMEPFAAVPERYVDGGDTIVVLGTDRGTVRSSGESLEAPFAHVCDFRDGRLVKFVDYTDTAAWQQAIGA
ncbi:nuclear transport factor 2 family protein [Halobaculum magnesiiphilum]|uniref:Nuclear transport factor 2 family protein n=1 Tax=Halobaculum magnesiiphilum TaxID=1017351 RepID=A0A8T8W9G2_9EURY|nr:nuclear transport factor 2 family protein [Halobaculum magnesiiphilum]QZP36477.1 nuclear transport factor 2 family protein [Halobaculum magnesiiphilum]